MVIRYIPMDILVGCLSILKQDILHIIKILLLENILGGHMGMGKDGAGSYLLDGSDYGDIFNIYESMLDNRYMDSNSYGMRHVNYQHLCTLPTSYTSYQLDLKIYKSGIDPNFVVFMWKFQRYLPQILMIIQLHPSSSITSHQVYLI